MRKKYFHFMPRTYGQRSVWLSNFGTKISVVGPTLGFSATQITSLEDAAQKHKDFIITVETKSKELDTARAALALSMKTDLKLIANAAVEAKRKVGYTDLLGSELGIIGSTQPIDLTTTRPILKVVANPDCVEVHFLLQGMKGVTIYSRLKGSGGWQMLSHDFESPYRDARPLADPTKPEVREYMARFFNGREDVGYESDLTVLTFTGNTNAK